jgi:competence protein ComFC
LIIHVLTTSSHVRQCGFDHTNRIARVISISTGLEHLPALRREGQQKQVGNKRLQRLTQINEAFLVTKPNLVKNAQIMLVVDVLTTGATIESAARAPKAAGANSIDTVVFAQAK